MATDDERRRVAAALRGLTSNVYGLRKSYESEGFSILCEEQADYYQMCKVACGYLPPEHMHPCDYEELHSRLADLIEPGDMSHGCRDTVACDRDALLALADEIEDNDVTYCVSTQYVLDSYARRIRECCGEV